MPRHTTSPTIYDLCVVGAGPAGLIAAGRAAECGERVILLEKNAEPGRKLLITGGGRCNVTNAEVRRHVLVEKYGDKGKYLHSLFARFDPDDVRRFFAERGLPTKVEAENRVFPTTDSAASVLNVLLDYAGRGGVELVTRFAVRGVEFERAERRITAVAGTSPVRAARFVFAVGGRSHPETGSTGDGFEWLKEMGHTVRVPEAALVPVRVREGWVRDLQGLSLPDVRLTALREPEVPPSGVAGNNADRRSSRCSERGKLLFTHFGLSGPLVLNMSRAIADLAGDEDEPATVRISIDLFPAIDHRMLERELQQSFDSAPNRKLRNALPPVLPRRLAPLLLRLSGAESEKPAGSVTKSERRAIVLTAKSLALTFDGLLGEERAIVTSGGVSLDEVDFRTMVSRLYPNLFIAGDILDFERRSGGYSLQICWASGWVAGSSGRFPAAQATPGV